MQQISEGVHTSAPPGPGQVDWNERQAVDALYERAWRLKQAEPAAARALSTEMIARAGAIGYRLGRAHGLLTGASVDRAESEYERGRIAAQEALDICREENDSLGEARALSLLGTIDRWNGEVDRCLHRQNECIAICRRFGYVEEESSALMAMSHALRVLGKVQEALDHATEAQRVAHDNGCREHEAFALLAVGSALERLYRYDDALAMYQQARAIGLAMDNRRILAYVTGNMSLIAYRIGDVPSALRAELECLEVKESLNDRTGIGISLNNIGLSYMDLGDYARSLEALVQSLEIAQGIGDREGESISLNNIGLLYEALGEKERLLDCYLQSLRISQEIGNVSGAAYSLSHLGRFYEDYGDHARALLYYLTSLRQFETCGSLLECAASHRYIGRVCRALGDREEASRHFLESLRGSCALGNAASEIETLIELATTERERGNAELAITRLEDALARADAVPFSHRHALLQLLAQACFDANEMEKHRTYRRLALDASHSAFDAAASRRVRELIARFDGGMTRREGRMLGLSEEDLQVIERMTQRTKQAPGGTQIAAASPAVHGRTVHPSTQAGTAPGIRVVTFGVLDVSVAGRSLGRSDWRRKRARDLFKLLLAHHCQWLTVDTIFEKLWNTGEERNMHLLVRNAVTHIRKAFAPDTGAAPPVQCVDGAYMLDLGPNAWIDFLKFKELIQSARAAATAGERRLLYQDAARLYNGDFLCEDEFQEWTSYERHMLKDAFLEAKEFLAREHLRSGELDQAIECARSIVMRDETSETAYEVLLTAQRARGRLADMRATFRQCEHAFQRELGQAPPRHLAALMAGTA
ncbi:MAG TPA: tetratricopeptide repeat protein [Candidatus Kapabacteria bacterium]|nr:tetratricopeptide repeat protein [Candidatus Kapabacteria bacterium]